MRTLRQQKRRLAAEREKGTLAVLPALAVKILDYVQDHGLVTTRDMVRKMGISPNTLKTMFSNLVKKWLLVRHGGPFNLVWPVLSGTVTQRALYNVPTG